MSSEQRRYAKVINFGLIYGMSSFGLARNLGIETAAAELHRALFPALSGGSSTWTRRACQPRAAATWRRCSAGRLYLPEINSPNGPRRGSAERQAINAPMQGTAADLIKLSMMKVQEVLDREQRARR